MFRFLPSLTLLLLAIVWPVSSVQAQTPRFEEAAKIASGATVTIRLSGDPKKPKSDEPAKVKIFSGVVVAKDIIATPLFLEPNPRIRITLAGGGQATGRAIVLDEHSGLALVQADIGDVKPLSCAKEEPARGSWVVCSSGWGAEESVISIGALSGVNRSIPGVSYPPLLQLDLRTVETSSGAPLVDTTGKLLGIVVAEDIPDARRGWTYAAPVAQVQRLLRAHAARAQNADPTQGPALLVMQKRRPVIGMVLAGNGEEVKVERVTVGGPAERAGLRKGDEILTTDGVKTRSAYQAVRTSMFKQPGDTISFQYLRDDIVKTTEVVLGGGVVLPSAPGIKLSNILRVKADELNPEATAGRVRHLAEVFDPGAMKPQANLPADQLKLLEKAIDRYQRVISILQEQRNRELAEREKAEQTITDLQREIETLRKQAFGQE